ncbi:MAG: hypothetical protein ACR2LI_04465 [Propionibacteriaceae bacterium]
MPTWLSTPTARLLAGLLIGVVGLLAMVRLVAGAFAFGSPYVWVFVALPMLAWIGYAGWRARRARLAGHLLVVVVALALIGLAVVWFGVGGPVLALGCCLGAFVVIWTHDLPARRPGIDQFVSVADLRRSDEQ